MINARFPYLVALFAALFFAVCSVANAETIPATDSLIPAVRQYKYQTSYFDQSAAACQALASANGATFVEVGSLISDSYVVCTYYQAPYQSTSNIYLVYRCLDGSQVNAGTSPQSCGSALACPADQNWTLSGATCTRPDCAAGFDRNSVGVCVKDCTGKVGQSTPSPSYEFPNGGIPSVGGCAVNCSNWRRAGGGTSLLPELTVGDACTYTGASSDGETTTEGTGFKPTPKAPTAPKDCIGSGMGYIQGSTGTTCVPQGEAPEGQKPVYEGGSEKEKGTPGTDGKPDPGAPDYEKEEKSIETKDGKIIESIKILKNGTPDGNGGTTCPEGFTLVSGTTQCSKMTTSTSTPNDFCTANPTSPACKGTKEGDECAKFPDRVGCVDLGASPDTPPITEEERGVSAISPVDLTQINSCPQGMLLPKGLGYYDFGPMCDFASGLKPVILAIAWLSAFFIVLGFSQGDD